MATPAVFFDRDGTLIEDVGYLSDPAAVSLLPTVADALRRLRAAGYERVVVSNQSGIARGLFDESALQRVESTLLELLDAEGAGLEAFYSCPHLDEGCDCRKPLPGLLTRAAHERNLDLTRSYLVGDRGRDVAAGHAAGVKTVFVTTGPDDDRHNGPLPDAVVATLADAATWILSHGH